MWATDKGPGGLTVARKTWRMIDLMELFRHWHTGRSQGADLDGPERSTANHPEIPGSGTDHPAEARQLSGHGAVRCAAWERSLSPIPPWQRWPDPYFDADAHRHGVFAAVAGPAARPLALAELDDRKY
ncbi:hypothetical protein RHA1_ro03193 [Rhodococcus jostii RHA1]|uniref:Uncharacterized protein n=2 Tax=Rhodococcus jostii TaxID=132919 RepID=Q0SBU0_RHOJR|nr:hypothetical protein RHA1_ro03193 [Rhodococcus jostii RHA1]